MRSRWWAWGLLAATACGRVGFDASADGGGTGDNGDASDSGGSVPPASSCAGGLLATCGPAGTTSCCESPSVVGGTYIRSFDVGVDGAFPDATNVATVSDFRLDKYEITVGRFRRFVDAQMGTQANPPPTGAGKHALIASSGWSSAWTANLPANTAALRLQISCDATLQTWTDTPGGNEQRPMNCLTWWVAMAFCVWDGGYLPTEAEWNYAAAGGSEQRAYPWSSPPTLLTIDGTRASYHDGTNCVGDGLPGCAVTDFVPVGTKPAGDGRWGHSDLGGNVWEWTLDTYGASYSINPCNDCADLTVGTGRASRGGYNFAADLFIRGANRFGNAPDFLTDAHGARCARPL